MKKLIMIGGTMGVGKTVTSKVLYHKLEKSVFLDGDWCWNMHPFVVNENTKELVLKNITYMLNNFIHTDEIENIVFCWVMHEQEIIDEILSRLDIQGCQVYPISLICSPQTLREHIQKDIADGKRNNDVFKRSLERLEMYKRLNTYQIDVTHQSVEEVANQIYQFVYKK